MDTSAWQRLADRLIERRASLRPEWSDRTTFARDAGLSYRSLSDLETARRDNYKSSWLTMVESAYQWAPGSIQAVLEGGDPSPKEAPRQETEPTSASRAWEGELVGPSDLLYDGEELHWRDTPRARTFRLSVHDLSFEAGLPLGTDPADAIGPLRRTMADRVATVSGDLLRRQG